MMLEVVGLLALTIRFREGRKGWVGMYVADARGIQGIMGGGAGQEEHEARDESCEVHLDSKAGR